MEEKTERAIHAAVLMTALLAAAAAVYIGWQLLPIYVAYSRFSRDLASQARLLGISDARADSLRRGIILSAQTDGIPLEPQDIRIDLDAPLPTVAADYSAPADLTFYRPVLHFHTQYPVRKAAFSLFDRMMLSGLGLLLGLFWFFKGFGLFRKYRVIADTPLVPIRSAAMGLVQIRGQATGVKTLRSPVSNQPCLLYTVEIDRWISGRSGSGRWSPYRTDTGWVGFYLEDETGRILVNPEGAEFDLEESTQCDIGSRSVIPLSQPESCMKPVRRAGLAASNDDLRDYVRRVAAGIDTAIFQGADLAGSARRKPRPRANGWMRSLFDSFLTFELGGLAGGFDHAPGDYRLTEHLIVPGGAYDVTGTCLLNPKVKEGADRNLLAKGSNAPTFLISDKSEKTIEQDLRGKAQVRIWGGALLALGAAAALLEAMGLLI